MSGSNTLQQQVGILGGGQLGCMLADAALRLGLEPRFYAERGSPAEAAFPERVTLGRVDDTASLHAFFARGLAVVAFENEFVDCDALERAAEGLALRFAPRLEVIRLLQDKLRQKNCLASLGIPTAEFLPIQPGEVADEASQRAFARFQGQVVFKWSRGGYDGKGVWLAEDSARGREAAARFCQEALDRGIAVYAECKIDFRRELAILGCASRSGEFAAYPLVLSEQARGICRRVLGPAQALGVPAPLEQQAAQAARKLAESTGLEGVFALELFELPGGGWAVNEIAPRVHNSGHYSQDACRTDQFENHWRALLGLGLGPIDCAPGFGMLNLLGPEDVTLTLPRRRAGFPFPPAPAPLKLHWYGKSEVRPGRKLGHLNAALPEASGFPGLERLFEHYHQSWVECLGQLQAPRSGPKS